MVLISVRFASRDAGFILKLPPTKNWRDMVDGGGLWGGVGMLECVIGSHSSESRMDRTSRPQITATHQPMLSDTVFRTSLRVLETKGPRVQDGEQAVTVSLVQFSPTRSIFLLFRCVARLGGPFPYRHAANVIVFPYGEWWAFRVINLHLVKSDVWLTVNWVRSGQLRPKDMQYVRT